MNGVYYMSRRNELKYSHRFMSVTYWCNIRVYIFVALAASNDSVECFELYEVVSGVKWIL